MGSRQKEQGIHERKRKSCYNQTLTMMLCAKKNILKIQKKKNVTTILSKQSDFQIKGYRKTVISIQKPRVYYSYKPFQKKLLTNGQHKQDDWIDDIRNGGEH